jgi:hypothetical protein
MFAALDRLMPVAGLVVVALEIWATVQAPGDGLNYLRLAWSLLFLTYLLRKRSHRAGRVTALLGIGASLVLVAVFFAQAAQAPGPHGRASCRTVRSVELHLLTLPRSSRGCLRLPSGAGPVPGVR